MRSVKHTLEPKKIRGNSRQKYVLLTLGILAFALVVSVFTFGKSNERIVKPELKLMEVPTRTVLKGERISDVPFAKIHWPVVGSISQVVSSASEVSNYYATNTLPAYVPISRAALKIESFDTNAVMEKIPAGYRAITVRVDIESVVEGWAQTGSYVDVILIRRSPDPDLGMEAKVIAENVKILAAGASVEQHSESKTAGRPPQTVTLLVTQEDALKIRTATTIGKLTFALRGMEDMSPSTKLSFTQKALLGGHRSLSVRPVTKYQGHATGPDGQVYTLDSESRWVKNLDSLSQDVDLREEDMK